MPEHFQVVVVLFFLQFLSYHCVHSDEHQETKSFFQANQTGGVDLDERALQRPAFLWVKHI